MAFCYVVTGTRGSGKGAYSVLRIKEALEEGRRVATNMQLFMNHIGDDETHYNVSRLPDFPTGNFLYQLGKAYEFDSNKPETMDASKEGLMILDEAFLYLSTAKHKDFDALVKYLVLSRKLGWNILIVCQNKDQLQDTIYRSLADKLIICRDNVNFRIPYLTNILNKLGFDSFIKDSHSAFIFSGRSELDDVEEEVPFKNRPHRLSYATGQLFTDQSEYLSDKFVDMRAVYTYLPSLYLSGNYFIQKLDTQKQKILTTYNKDLPAMATKSKGFDTAFKIKIGLLLGGVLVYMYFSSPMDNKFLKQAIGDTSDVSQQVMPTQQVIPTQQALSVPSQSAPVNDVNLYNNDFVAQLFANYRPRLTAYMSSEKHGTTAIIDFYMGDEIYERLTLKEFHLYGYSVEPSANAVVVRGNNFLKRVSSWPLRETTQNPTPAINNG